MKDGAEDFVVIDTDYDLTGWLHDRFGFDTEAHYVGTEVSIIMVARDSARLRFDMMVTHADLADLISRRKS